LPWTGAFLLSETAVEDANNMTVQETGELHGARQELRLLLSHAPAVVAAKLRAGAGHTLLVPARDRILMQATENLDAAPLTVTTKTILAPSGDPHDYVSMSSYHWPNPDTADGLPYIRRDGQINPEVKETDLGRFQKLAVIVPNLCWAYFLSDDQQFASKAIAHIRTWFIDPATRMNPHLRYAGHIPGVVDGRRVGVTDTKSIRFILDTIGFLRASPLWKETDEDGIRSWTNEYLEWLLTSKFGREEFAATNNHGTWYDVQVLACAMFTGRDDAIAKIHDNVPRRITGQFACTGAQPHELKRTRPLQYCMMNLQGFFEIATMLSTAGLDVWSFQTPDGKSLRRATEWLAPYALGHKTLATSDVVKATPRSYLSVFRRAAIEWSDWRFEVVMHMIDHDAVKQDLLQIQYPLDLGFETGIA
jgi:hypothetical protein